MDVLLIREGPTDSGNSPGTGLHDVPLFLPDSILPMSLQRWRVVAVRRNRKLIILDEYLSKERAEAFQASLLSINAFPDVWIEPDPATPRGSLTSPANGVVRGE